MYYFVTFDFAIYTPCYLAFEYTRGKEHYFPVWDDLEVRAVFDSVDSAERVIIELIPQITSWGKEKGLNTVLASIYNSEEEIKGYMKIKGNSYEWIPV